MAPHKQLFNSLSQIHKFPKEVYDAQIFVKKNPENSAVPYGGKGGFLFHTQCGGEKGRN